jgi:hypothetical protein
VKETLRISTGSFIIFPFERLLPPVFLWRADLPCVPFPKDGVLLARNTHCDNYTNETYVGVAILGMDPLVLRDTFRHHGGLCLAARVVPKRAAAAAATAPPAVALLVVDAKILSQTVLPFSATAIQ